MPPRKRARLSPRTTSSAVSTPVASSPPPNSKQTATPLPSSPDVTDDPWTTGQETALLKALIRFKPTGINKHFNMLSISTYMHSTDMLKGPRHGQEEDLEDTHLSIPGIWDKLSTLYDLQALDEKEDSHLLNRLEDQDFKLPGNGESPFPSATPDANGDVRDEVYFSNQMWRRRFPNPDLEDSDAESSEPEILFITRGRDGGVEDVTPAASTSGKAKKKGPTKAAETARRKTRKVASPSPVAKEEEDEKEEELDTQQEGEGDEDEEEEEEEEEGEGDEEDGEEGEEDENENEEDVENDEEKSEEVREEKKGSSRATRTTRRSARTSEGPTKADPSNREKRKR